MESAFSDGIVCQWKNFQMIIDNFAHSPVKPSKSNFQVFTGVGQPEADLGIETRSSEPQAHTLFSIPYCLFTPLFFFTSVWGSPVSLIPYLVPACVVEWLG